MPEAVIVSAVRTPIGRYGGALAGVRADDLAAIAVGEAVSRAGVDASAIEDVYLGCANQAGEDNRNVARMAALLAGLPDSVPGVTVNRLCASGLAAVVAACHAVRRGRGRPVRRRWRRVDDACAARDRQAREAVRARRPRLLRHDARLALPEPGDGRALPAGDDGRDGRERRRALGRLARGSGRVRCGEPGALGGGAGGRAASPTSWSRSASWSRTSTRGRGRRWRSSRG